MEKVLSFESSADHYTADACVVWCFDDRFFKLLKAFGKQQNFNHIDLVKLAGGAKVLAGDATPEREFILGQIKASMRLHGTKKAILMVHMDCGGYGGSAAFDNDRQKESAHHEAELRKAMAFVKGEIPDIDVAAYIADFDGLYAVSA